MDDRPNIILSPHFDDAVLSLGGLIAKSPERAWSPCSPEPERVTSGRWDR